MDYQKHYDKLVERAKNRTLDEYTEKHRVLPGCLGGTYAPENVVHLTPEEHYVAHQLLIKIYPHERKLIHAAMMMTVESGNQDRSKNRLYGWLKREYVSECRKRTGKKNPSYGKSWYHDPKTLENGKFAKDDVPTGWEKGRVPPSKCAVCDKRISNVATYCVKHGNENRKRTENGKFTGRESEFYEYHDKLGSMNKACKAMGFLGAVGSYYVYAKRLLDQRT